MNPEIQILAVVGSLLMAGLVFQLIRARRLREEYAVLWFVAGILLIVLSLWRDLLHTVARLVGVEYPPSVLLLGGIVLGFLISLHFSIALSRLAEQNKRLAQELALLRQELSARGIAALSALDGPPSAPEESEEVPGRPEPGGIL